MTGDERSDADIVRDVLDGDRDGYGLLVQRYQQRLVAAMWRATGDRAEAEELAQAVFCRAYFALASYDPSYRFSTWLFRIAHNYSINQRKRRRELALAEMTGESGRPGLVPSDPAPSPAETLEQRELAQVIGEAIAALPEEFRDAIHMRHVQELSYQEICEALDLPMGTVKSRIARGRQRLAEELAARLR